VSCGAKAPLAPADEPQGTTNSSQLNVCSLSLPWLLASKQMESKETPRSRPTHLPRSHGSGSPGHARAGTQPAPRPSTTSSLLRDTYKHGGLSGSRTPSRLRLQHEEAPGDPPHASLCAAFVRKCLHARWNIPVDFTGFLTFHQ
jgi:hypothetical protein